jgi:hypothetical protein
VDSTLLSALHPREVKQSCGSEGPAWVRWGSFAVYEAKLHILCSTNCVPLAYELTAANAADVALVPKVMFASVLVARRHRMISAPRSGRVKPFVRKGQGPRKDSRLNSGPRVENPAASTRTAGSQREQKELGH